MTWNYPEYLEKSSTELMHVERVRHNGTLILTHKETGFSNSFIGYGIQEAKRQFKATLKEKGYI